MGDEITVVEWPRRRPGGPWRDGAEAVVVLTFDLDAESPVLAAGEQYANHLATMSHQAYGPRVGVRRILELLDSYDLPCTFFVPGVSVLRWPDAVELVGNAGHELALHGYTHRQPVDLTASAQREEMERSMAVFEQLGVAPRGYRAPMWQLTTTTLDLVGEYGLEYDSSLLDDDRPYVVEAGGRSIAELPGHWLLDDWEQYAFLPAPNVGQQIEAPSKVVELWTAELDAMRHTGSLCVLTCHPFITGRPSRIAALERFITFALACGDVAFASAEQVATRVLAPASGDAASSTRDRHVG